MEPDIDLYELFAGEEPSAKGQAAAITSLLRKKRGQNETQRAVGNLGLLTGDRVLGNFGASQIQQAGQSDTLAQNEEQLLSHAGQFRLTQAMAKQKADAALATEKEKHGASLKAAKEKQTGDLTEGLRKEVNGLPEVKSFKDVDVSFLKMQGAAKTPNAAGDLALIFSFMRMLDPGSSVKEGEFANAQNAAGVPDRIRNVFNQVTSGQRLNPDQRAEFMAQAQNFHGAHLKAAKTAVDRYRQLATKGGANPDDVAAELGAVAPPPAVSAAGTNIGGDVQPAKVTVSNGKETLEIDFADLPHAEKDGFKRVK